MKERRPGVAASVAFALAAVVSSSIFFDLYTFLYPVLNSERIESVRYPIMDRFPVLFFLVPNVVLASLPLILCVSLYAALWPFVNGTPARPFMVAALVAALPTTIIAVLNVLLPPFVRPPGPELLTGMFWLIAVSNGLLGLLLAVALRRSGLFSVWVPSLALAWAGLELIVPLGITVLLAIPLGIETLRPLHYWLADTTGLVKNYISPVVLTMLLLLLGLEMLALRGVSNKGIEQTAQASI